MGAVAGRIAGRTMVVLGAMAALHTVPLPWVLSSGVPSGIFVLLTVRACEVADERAAEASRVGA
jgi:hypothetical protein